VISTKAASATIIAIFMATALFGAWLIMPAGVEAAEYEENATDSNVTVKSYVACGMPASWANGVEFGSLDPDTSSNQPNPDTNYTMLAPGSNNVDIDFYITANDSLTKGSDTIPLANYTWNMTSPTDTPEPGDGTSTALTTGYVEGALCDGTSNGTKCFSYFWLDIPVNTPAGTYVNELTMKCNQTD
jgi:hypothetical protein